MIPYAPAVEQQMKYFYESLCEKDRRRYAAVEAAKLGHGGVEYVASVLGCDRNTIRHGREDIAKLPEDEAEGRIRKKGGRKKASVKMPELKENFTEVLVNHTAGDPMNEDVVWTYLSQREIADALAELGTPVSTEVVRDLLSEYGFAKRKAQKARSMGDSPHRNEQFEYIAALLDEYLDAGEPALSMDTKKKEMLGNFYRAGQVYTTETIEAYDHDFKSHSSGMVIPHGLYDLARNVGHITLGISHDTSQFACDAVRTWWRRYGEVEYPRASEMLLLCDCGGSNSNRHYIFKEDLQRLANELELSIRIAHYPPYCSKYNPIEHRLFPHVTRACKGVIFHTLEIVRRFMRRTSTNTGLRITLNTLNKAYKTRRKASAAFLETMPIEFDDFLPQWNYTAVPGSY